MKGITIELLEALGYRKIGEVDGSILYSNIGSSCNAQGDEKGFIYQFDLKIQEEHIGKILITKEILEKMILN